MTGNAAWNQLSMFCFKDCTYLLIEQVGNFPVLVGSWIYTEQGEPAILCKVCLHVCNYSFGFHNRPFYRYGGHLE